MAYVLAPRSSNRTFMELKYGLELVEIAEGVGSNRTFMELKCGCPRRCGYGWIVLIVPLWN